MHLFHVQDPDRPMYVLAKSWKEAFNNWCEKVAKENDCSTKEVGEPKGIEIIANADDVLIKAPDDDEKEARVYYQNIVYDVCNTLDKLDGYHVSQGPGGIVCGTVTNPTTEVQDRLRALVEQYKDYQNGFSHLFPAEDTEEKAAQYQYAAVIDVVAERAKQRQKWSAEHDDGHESKGLAHIAGGLAIRYAKHDNYFKDEWGIEDRHPDPRERLVIAAALLIAEIERIDRLAQQEEAQPKCPEEPPREILGMTFQVTPNRKLCIEGIRLDSKGGWWVGTEVHKYEWDYFWNMISDEDKEAINQAVASSATTTRSEHSPQTS